MTSSEEVTPLGTICQPPSSCKSTVLALENIQIQFYEGVVFRCLGLGFFYSLAVFEKQLSCLNSNNLFKQQKQIIHVRTFFFLSHPVSDVSCLPCVMISGRNCVHMLMGGTWRINKAFVKGMLALVPDLAHLALSLRPLLMQQI